MENYRHRLDTVEKIIEPRRDFLRPLHSSFPHPTHTKSIMLSNNIRRARRRPVERQSSIMWSGFAFLIGEYLGECERTNTYTYDCIPHMTLPLIYPRNIIICQF